MENTTYQPCALLYACTGALIGTFATLQVPATGFPSFPPVPPAILSLTSIAEGISLIEPDPIAWIEEVGAVPRAAMGLVVETVTVREGNTLVDVLVKAGVDRTSAFSVVDAVLKVYDLTKLQVGQELDLTRDALAETGDAMPLAELNFEVDASHSISVTRSEDGSYAARDIVAKTHREFARSEGVIGSTLFEAAAAQNLPQDVLTAMVKLFSYDVDFQRDLQKGDLVMFGHRGTITHIGIYSGNGQFVHATHRGSPVMVTSLDADYYNTRYLKAVRLTPQ